MEFLTTQQKKKKAQRLYFGYALLTILILLATYVLISTALGFDVLNSKGTVVQNGLLFIDTRPDGAEVYINGKKESNNTNAKFALPESNYLINLKKNGYRDWNGAVSLMGGTVEFLTYPRLLPLEPKVITTLPIASVPLNLQSKDRRWLLNYSAESPKNITVSDLNNPIDPLINLVIPESVTGSKAIQSVELLEWAGDNEHFLIEVRLADTPAPQYVIMHRQKQEEIVNASTVFNTGPDDKIGLWDNKHDKVFIRQPTGIVLLGNLKDKSLSAQSLVADSVIEFFPQSKERALYTAKSGEETLVKYYSDGKIYSVAPLHDPTKPLIVEMFSYNRNDYVLLAGSAFEKTLIYRNLEKAVSSNITGRLAPFFIMPNKSTASGHSRSGRFVMGAEGKKVQVYDIERKKFHSYDLAVDQPAQLGWFDDVRLYSVGNDSKLSVFDFTGGNLYTLTEDSRDRPYVSSDVKKVQYVIKGTDSPLLSKTVDIDTANPVN